MIEDVEQGLVGTVIVKDLSRLGRNYLITGQYTELIFPSYDVRFIAISDNVDSDEGLSDLLPFSNLINEWYCRDISRKQKAVIQQKGNAGQRLTPNAIYGYKKSQEDKHIWLIDEPAAKVVRLIFNLYVDGYGLSKIAHHLESEQILSPSAYFGRFREGSAAAVNPYHWSPQTIANILSKPEYCGDTVNFRTEKPSYKSKRILKHDPKDYKIFRNTQDAIIDRDVFERAQEKLAQRKRVPAIKEKPLYSGYLICHDCGCRMYLTRTRTGTNPHYVCGGYRKAIRICTAHYIREESLTEQVLSEIRSIVEDYKKNPKAFTKKIQNKFQSECSVNEKKAEKRLSEIMERLAEIEMFIQKLYEDKVKGNISQEVFANLTKKYTDEKTGLFAEREMLKCGENEKKQFVKKFNQFVAAVESIGSIVEVTPDLLRGLIDKIEVYEGVKEEGKRREPAKIKVYFIGIGDLS